MPAGLKGTLSMAKYNDTLSAGSSHLVPFIRNERPRKRHRRRLRINLKYEDEVAVWARLRGLKLRVTDGGQHWQFRGMYNGYRFSADWWPSSAKLVVNQRWDRGIHVHDYRQVQTVLEPEIAKFYQLQWGHKGTQQVATKRPRNRSRSEVPVRSE